MGKMTVLISSYSPRTVASYSQMIRNLIPRLIRSGEFEFIQHAWFDSTALPDVEWRLVPTNIIYKDDGTHDWDSRDKWGSLTFAKVCQEVKPDIVFSLSDIYMSHYLNAAANKYNFKLVRWSLVAADPVHMDDLLIVKGADRCVAQTRYAANIWEAATGKNYDVIPPGVDTNVFKPIDEERRLRARTVNLSGDVTSDDLLLLWVGVNQDRKRPWIPFEVTNYLKTGQWGWDERGVVLRPWDPTFQCFREWEPPSTMASPIPAKLWVHSAEMPERWSYMRLSEMFNLAGGKDVFATRGLTRERGLSPEDLATLYQMSDCLLMLSGSEGFGCPVAEAACCGTRTIYTDYSGCGEAGRSVGGIPVKAESFYIAPSSHTRIANPSVGEAVKGLYNLHQQKMNSRKAFDADREKIANIARGLYNLDKIAVAWINVLREVHETPKITTLGTTV